METLLALDHSLFLFINHLPHTLLTDTIALTLSGVLGSTVLIWLLLSIWLFVREEKRDHWFFVPVILASSLSLTITEYVLKNIFARGRPPDTLGVIQIGSKLSDYSFPSGHATFAWALAIVLANKEPRGKWIFYGLAFFISASRIYLGKHYPADIVAGSIVGIVIGLCSLWLERMLVKRNHKRHQNPRNV